MNNQSTELIRYTIPAGMQENFKSCYAEAGRYLSQSVYCLGYQLLHGEDEKENFIVVINWTSKDDHLSGFRNSMEFKAFFEIVRPFYNHILEMKHYNTTAIGWQKQPTV